MLTIYWDPVSLYCAKLRITLRHKDLTWEEVPPPGGYGSAEYKALVPAGNLPAMVEDGFLLSDSEAIAEYLNEKYPEPAMLPEDMKARAQARMRGRFHDTRVEPTVRAVFPFVAASARDPKKLAECGAALSTQLHNFSQVLNANPLPSETLWLCDTGFAITFEWMKLFETSIGLPIDWPKEALAYRETVPAHSAVAEELAAYRPHMQGYIDLKNRS